MVKKLILLAATWLLVLPALADDLPLPEAAPSRESTLQTIVARGELRVGMEAGYMPFEMKDKQGNIVGFDVDMAQAVANAMGVKLKLINTPWEQVIPGLLADKFDIIMSGMTITPSRNLRINFAKPYIIVGQTILVRKALAKRIKSYKDLNNSQFTVATKKGVTAEHACRRYMPKAQLKLYDTEGQAAQQVLDGRADAFVYDLPFNAIYFAERQDRLAFLEKPFTYEPLGWAVRKGDPDFLNWLDNFLALAKGDGTFDDIYHRWLGSNQWLKKVQ